MDHGRLVELFDRLCELEPEEQERRLRSECEDEDAREVVRGMLAADRTPLRLLDPVGEGLLEALVEGASSLPERIGPYRVLRVLGAGGMGVVYEAEQESPRRRVALKVPASTFVTPELSTRLAREGRVLGQLKHPCIAQIYEAGTFATPGGVQPFLAMELVEGEPLSDFVHARRLGIGEVLELVIQVCGAVQHAHERGILHRDLKPGNVLVQASGRPMVLDFGVARALDPDGTLSLATHTGELVGTLRYMSPEQAAGGGEELDARSDVYSLGVMLYELLAGQPPHALGDLPLHQAARVIVEQEPTRLGALDRHLAGDLETIVGKALEKDKERRYASAEELAADLRRHLTDRPIHARPPSTIYQWRKFARRNRGLVSGALAVLLVSTTGAIVSTFLYLDSQANLVRAERAEGEWKAAAGRAERKALLAERVRAFLVSLFDVSDPTGARGAEIRARDLLDQGRERIDRELADEPEVRSALLSTMGRVYQKLGEFDTAIPLLEESIETQREALARDEGDAHDLANALFLLGEAHHFRLELVEARSAYESALELYREHVAPDHPDVTRCLDVYGRLERDAGNRERALELVEDAYARRRANPDTPPLDLTESLQSLGSIAYLQGRVDDAERYMREAIERRRALGRDGEARVPELLHSLSEILRYRGEWEEAEAAMDDVVAMVEEIFGPEHVFYSHALEGLSYIRARRGDLDGSMELLLHAQELLPADHPHHAELLDILASVMHERGRYEDALDAYSRAIERYEAQPIVNWQSLATVRSNMTITLIALGRLEDARDALMQSVDEFRKVDDGRSVSLAAVLRNLARTERLLGNHDEACAAARESVELEAAHFGEGSQRWRRAVGELVEALDAAGLSDEAQEWRATLAATPGR